MIKVEITFEQMPNGDVKIHARSHPGFATKDEEKALKKLLPMMKHLHSPRSGDKGSTSGN